MSHHPPAPRTLLWNRVTAVLLAAASLLPVCGPPAAAEEPHHTTVRRRVVDCQLLLNEKRLLGWDGSAQEAKVERAKKLGRSGDLAGALALLDQAERELRYPKSKRGKIQIPRITGELLPAGEPVSNHQTPLTAGSLHLDFDGAGRVSRVALGDRTLNSPVSGGFYAEDAATGMTGVFNGRATKTGDGIELAGEITGMGAHLEARFQHRADWLEVEGTVKDTSGTDRALVLCFKIPFLRQGFTWWDNLEFGKSIEQGDIVRQNSARVLLDSSSTRLASIYPLACLTNGSDTGLALATAIDHPAVFRINYDGLDQSINIYYDLGLTAKTTKLPGGARFRFVIYPLENPGWGFRSALQTYYRIYPGAFAHTVEDPGLWGTSNAAALLGEEYRKMGFSFLQGENSDSTQGRKLGLWSLRYCRPWSLFIPGSTEPVKGQLAGLIADPGGLNLKHSHQLIFGRVSARELVTAAEMSAIHDRTGEPLSVPDRVHRGVKLILNTDPEIEGGQGGKNSSMLTLEKAIAPAAGGFKSQGQHRWGLFFDVAGTDLKHENFRQAHMAFTDYPLTFDEKEKRPVILGISSACEYLSHIRTWAGQRGGMVGVNTSPHPYNLVFLAPFCDMAGTEHMPGLREMYNRRALACRKPIGFRTDESWEALLKTGLFFGAFPSRTPPGRVRTNLDHLEQAKPLITRLVPLIRKLDAAGWEPVTLARTGRRDLPVERFGSFEAGPVYLTVWNRTPADTDVTLRLDQRAASWCENTPRVVELAGKRKVSTSPGTIRLHLGTDEVAVLRLDRPVE